MRLKKNRKISAKKRNVAIKRVKSNASALAISSDSNIDEVNHAKVSKNSLLFIRNVELLEVAYNYSSLKPCSTTAKHQHKSIRIVWIIQIRKTGKFRAIQIFSPTKILTSKHNKTSIIQQYISRI
ncbi:MAG: hypothetical protein J6V54_04290 [Bacteroidales bacterium]|nr:hypothetical protein [Bacteroidales bacterium]